MPEKRCIKCQRQRPLTKHHILPRRFFGHSETSPCLLICRTCHSDLETLIPEKELQTVHFYYEVIFIFLATDKIRVVEWSGKRSYKVRRDESKSDLQPVSAIIGKVLDKLPRPKVPPAPVLRNHPPALQKA